MLSISNPLDALDTFRNLSDEVQLVITDNIMPLMEGKELIRNLRAIKPEIKIISISGYSDELIDIDDIDAFIRKPFEGTLLLSTVRRVLDVQLKEPVQ